MEISEIKKKLRALHLNIGDIIETPLTGAIWETKQWVISKEFLEWIYVDEKPHKSWGLIPDLNPDDFIESTIKTEEIEPGVFIEHVEGEFKNSEQYDPFEGMHPDHIFDIKSLLSE
jgi:hypothetical protein